MRALFKAVFFAAVLFPLQAFALCVPVYDDGGYGQNIIGWCCYSGETRYACFYFHDGQEVRSLKAPAVAEAGGPCTFLNNFWICHSPVVREEPVVAESGGGTCIIDVNGHMWCWPGAKEPKASLISTGGACVVVNGIEYCI